MANTEMLSKTHNPLFKKPNPSGGFRLHVNFEKPFQGLTSEQKLNGR